ncbi:MAG: NAD(P)-dependent alcohol dehydrogenase [Ignavibacteriae bacterium]|nr:NAD(P)-dependent alcohol dehydrogenase [Ignavibacteriota bacterium]
MRAIEYKKYGPPEVLHMVERVKPVPGDNDVLIRVHATTVTSGDCRLRSLRVPLGFGLLSRLALGVTGPRNRVLGVEFAGVVEAPGSAVDLFKAGDEVFGLSGSRMGGYAEYVCLPQDAPLALKPPALSFVEAAALSFGGTTALDFFRRAGLHSGESVLVNGASGAVGTAAVQLARHFGAEVTAVCSAANAELLHTLGAAEVIDYSRTDFSSNGKKYDVIVDAVGNAPFSRSASSLAENGRLLLLVADLPAMLSIPVVSLLGRKKVIAGSARERAEDLRFLAELAQAGVFTPVLDRCYSLEQIVEAHRYVDTGRKAGNVAITVAV